MRTYGVPCIKSFKPHNDFHMEVTGKTIMITDTGLIIVIVMEWLLDPILRAFQAFHTLSAQIAPGGGATTNIPFCRWAD